MEEDKISLTPYEQTRTPQALITDPNRRLAVSPRALRPLFICSICLDVLKNTMITKECMHRFCNECIITALRSGNKECPNCRMKLVSKRSLRADKSFDEIIAKIYPNREDYASQSFVPINSKTTRRGFATTHGDSNSKNKSNKNKQDNVDEVNDDEDEDIPNEISDDEIELVVKPFPTSGNRVSFHFCLNYIFFQFLIDFYIF